MKILVETNIEKKVRIMHQKNISLVVVVLFVPFAFVSKFFSEREKREVLCYKEPRGEKKKRERKGGEEKRKRKRKERMKLMLFLLKMKEVEDVDKKKDKLLLTLHLDGKDNLTALRQHFGKV